MNLFDALTFAKDYLDREARSFISFFQEDRKADDPDQPYGQLATSALFCLVIGVTLQVSYISGLKINEISWLDRALGQIVFWLSIGLFAHMLVRLVGGRRDGSALQAVFAVMPVAFLCGAYAASIGYFIGYVTRIVAYTAFDSDQQFLMLPNWFNLAAQLTVLARYMPRELRIRCFSSRGESRLVSLSVLFLVLIIDLVVALGENFLPVNSVKG